MIRYGRYGRLAAARTDEVAGRLAIEAAGRALQRHTGGRGLLIGGVPGVALARVVVIGGRVVGTDAARTAVGLGADRGVITNKAVAESLGESFVAPHDALAA